MIVYVCMYAAADATRANATTTAIAALARVALWLGLQTLLLASGVVAALQEELLDTTADSKTLERTRTRLQNLAVFLELAANTDAYADRALGAQPLPWLTSSSGSDEEPPPAAADGLELLSALCDHCVLMGDGGEDEAAARRDVAQFMTIHAAKGKEFDCVAIARVNEGVLPSSRACSQAEMAQERNTLYVALTRARQEQLVSWVATARSMEVRRSTLLDSALQRVLSGDFQGVVCTQSSGIESVVRQVQERQQRVRAWGGVYRQRSGYRAKW
jgi:superfamily I DNA/RNA helicase